MLGLSYASRLSPRLESELATLFTPPPLGSDSLHQGSCYPVNLTTCSPTDKHTALPLSSQMPLIFMLVIDQPRFSPTPGLPPATGSLTVSWPRQLLTRPRHCTCLSQVAPTHHLLLPASILIIMLTITHHRDKDQTSLAAQSPP